MSKSHRDKSLFSSQDQKYHDASMYVTDGREQAFINTYGTNQPYQYWDPSVGQMPYVPYVPTGLYQPYEYQIAQPSYPQGAPLLPVPVSNISKKNTSALLPPAPLGRTPQDSSTVFPSTTAVYYTPIYPTIPPPYYNHLSQPYAYAPPPPPPPPQPYYYPRSPPSPYYHSRRPPSPYDYHDRSGLPHISRNERRRERDHADRYRDDDPFIMSYFDRRHNLGSYRKQKRWYE